MLYLKLVKWIQFKNEMKCLCGTLGFAHMEIKWESYCVFDSDKFDKNADIIKKKFLFENGTVKTLCINNLH